MKKLTLLAFMVMSYFTVFCSNNQPAKDEPTEKKLVLNPTCESEKVFSSNEKETFLVDLNDDIIILCETNTEIVIYADNLAKENSLQETVSESQCIGTYIYDLIVVDNIKYIPDLRPWYT